MPMSSAPAVVVTPLEPVVSHCHIGDQFARIQACKATAWCIRNQLASRISLPMLCMRSCKTMSGSIALRIHRSGRFGPIGEIQRLIHPPYGTLCFGDLELQEDNTLLVSWLSDARMEVLLDLLRPLNLGTPKIQRDVFPRLEKPGRKRPRGKRRRTF